LGKLVTRKYADNSKHIFPFARWELFDPEKDVPWPVKYNANLFSIPRRKSSSFRGSKSFIRHKSCILSFLYPRSYGRTKRSEILI
jgi:XAP5, circadian clock regulator